MKYDLETAGIRAIEEYSVGSVSDEQIPRIIHQVCKSRDELRQELKENAERIKLINPGWEYRLYDDKDMESFVSEHFGEHVLSLYKRIDPTYGAARADFFRYLCIYHAGGVYLDIKSSVDVSLDISIRDDDKFLLSQWDDSPDAPYSGFGCHRELRHVVGGEYQQWHIVATPRHPYLKQVILQVIRNICRYNPFTDGIGRRGVLRTTGPIAYTLAISPIVDLHPHRVVDVFVACGFRYSIFDAESATNAHRTLLGAHYSKNRKPVVQLRGAVRFGWVLVDAIRRLWAN